jgi:hypothetical protein
MNTRTQSKTRSFSTAEYQLTKNLPSAVKRTTPFENIVLAFEAKFEELQTTQRKRHTEARDVQAHLAQSESSSALPPLGKRRDHFFANFDIPWGSEKQQAFTAAQSSGQFNMGTSALPNVSTAALPNTDHGATSHGHQQHLKGAKSGATAFCQAYANERASTKRIQRPRKI